MSDAVKSAKTRDLKSPAETPQSLPVADASGGASKLPVSAVVKSLREEQIKTLKSGNFTEYGHVYDRVCATIPADCSFEDTLLPGFWTNVLDKLRKNTMTGGHDRSGSIIELRREDHAFYAELYVRGILSRGVIVACLGPAVDPKTGAACPISLSTGRPWTGDVALSVDDFKLVWNRDKRGFDIIRTSDQQIVADGVNFPTSELALEWISKTAKAA